MKNTTLYKKTYDNNIRRATSLQKALKKARFKIQTTSKTVKSKLEQPDCNNLATNKIVCSVAEPQLSILSENLQFCSMQMKLDKIYE